MRRLSFNISLPAFLHISSVTYAEPGRWAKSRWESAGEHIQKGLSPASRKEHDSGKQMPDFVTHSSKWQVLLKSDMIFIIQPFINPIVDASLSASLGHTTVVCQSLGLIGHLTALERNVFDLEGITHQQAVSTFCLFPQKSLSAHLNPSPQRPQASQCCHLPHRLLFPLLYSYSFHLHPFVSTNLHAPPPPLQSSSA